MSETPPSPARRASGSKCGEVHARVQDTSRPAIKHPAWLSFDELKQATQQLYAFECVKHSLRFDQSVNYKFCTSTPFALHVTSEAENLELVFVDKAL